MQLSGGAHLHRVVMKCKTALTKYSSAQLTEFLMECNKLSNRATEVNHTAAINTMADVNSDEKEYFQNASGASAVELDELIQRSKHWSWTWCFLTGY